MYMKFYYYSVSWILLGKRRQLSSGGGSDGFEVWHRYIRERTFQSLKETLFPHRTVIITARRSHIERLVKYRWECAGRDYSPGIELFFSFFPIIGKPDSSNSCLSTIKKSPSIEPFPSSLSIFALKSFVIFWNHKLLVSCRFGVPVIFWHFWKLFSF